MDGNLEAMFAVDPKASLTESSSHGDEDFDVDHAKNDMVTRIFGFCMHALGNMFTSYNLC